MRHQFEGLKESFSSEESEIDVESIDDGDIDSLAMPTLTQTIRKDFPIPDMEKGRISECSNSGESGVDVDDSINTFEEEEIAKNSETHERENVLNIKDNDKSREYNIKTSRDKSKLMKCEFKDQMAEGCHSSEDIDISIRAIDHGQDTTETFNFKRGTIIEKTDLRQHEQTRSMRIGFEADSKNSRSSSEKSKEHRTSVKRNKETLERKEVQRQQVIRPYQKSVLKNYEKDSERNEKNYRDGECASSGVRRGDFDSKRQEIIDLREKRRMRKEEKKKRKRHDRRLSYHGKRRNNRHKYFDDRESRPDRKHRKEAKEKHSRMITHTNHTQISRSIDGISEEHRSQTLSKSLDKNHAKTSDCYRHCNDRVNKNLRHGTCRQSFAKDAIKSNSEYHDNQRVHDDISMSSKNGTDVPGTEQKQHSDDVEIVKCSDEGIGNEIFQKKIMPFYCDKKEIVENESSSFDTFKRPSKNVNLRGLNTANENKIVKCAAVTGIPKTESLKSTPTSYSYGPLEKDIAMQAIDWPHVSENNGPNCPFPNNQDQLLQNNNCFPLDVTNATHMMALLLNGIPQNNLKNSFCNELPKIIPIESISNVGMAVDANGTLTKSNYEIAINSFEAPKLIPTESRYPVGLSCQQSVERYRTPEMIDLPASGVLNIYHCFPKEIVEKCSAYDPRIKKCQIITSEPNMSGMGTGFRHSNKTDIVSTIIQASQVPLADIIKRNNMVPFEDKPKESIQINNTNFSSSRNHSTLPVKPTIDKGDVEKLAENNFSSKTVHVTSFDKNAVFDYLKEFSEIERALSPVLCDVERENDNDDDDDVDNDKNHVQKDPDNHDNNESEGEGVDDEIISFQNPTKGHKPNDFIFCKTKPHPIGRIEESCDNVMSAEKCQPDGHLVTFLNTTSNNPYGNEDPDPLVIRDGSESVTPEDDDAPMQDEMSSPVLLNACDRVYHIKRDTDTENTSNAFYSTPTQPCPSWFSHGIGDELGQNRTGCHPSSRRVRQTINPNTDILGQAMINAGLSEHTIDSLLNSNSAVENTFCEDELYTEFCTEGRETNNKAVATSITTTTVSDSCLPSTSSFIQQQFLSNSADFTEDEIKSLLCENSKLLDMRCNQFESFSTADGQTISQDQDHQLITSFTFSGQNEENLFKQLPGGCNGYPPTALNDDQMLYGKDCSLKENTTAEECHPLTLHWESLDFIDASVNTYNTTKTQGVAPALSIDVQNKREHKTYDNKKGYSKTNEKINELSAEMGSSREHNPNDIEFDFDIGGVIVPGSSNEKRSRRIRTLEEVKNFDKKYLVPRLVVDQDPRKTQGDISNVKGRKASIMSSTRNTRGRNLKASRSQESVNDETTYYIDIASKHGDIDDNVKSSRASQNTRRSLRSSIQSRNQNTIKYDDDTADGPMTSMTPKRKRGKRALKRKGKESKNIRNNNDSSTDDAHEGLAGSNGHDTATNTAFTAQVFRATIRPAVVLNGTPKPHKYRLIQKSRRHCYLFRARPDPAHASDIQQRQQEEGGICWNNNSNNDPLDEPPQTSSAISNEMELKAMKRNLRQKDKDLEKYYSRCQRRPEKSSFVNSMIHKSLSKSSLSLVDDSNNSVVINKPHTSTSPINGHLKLSFPLDDNDDSETENELLRAQDPDLPPCILRFVTRMMGNYGDYFSDSTDATSREKRLRLCDSYLRSHGIKTDSLHQLLRQKTDGPKTSKFSGDKTTMLSNSQLTPEASKLTSKESFVENTVKSQSESLQSTLQKDEISAKNSSSNEDSIPGLDGIVERKLDKKSSDSKNSLLPEINHQQIKVDNPSKCQSLSKKKQIAGNNAEKIIENCEVVRNGNDTLVAVINTPNLERTLSLSNACLSEKSESKKSIPNDPTLKNHGIVENSVENKTSDDFMKQANEVCPISKFIINDYTGTVDPQNYDCYALEYSSSEENVLKVHERDGYVTNQVLCELNLPTEFKGVDFEGPTPFLRLRPGTEMQNPSQNDDLVSLVTHNINVAEMFDDFETEVGDLEQISTSGESYEENRHFGCEEFGEGDIHFSRTVGRYGEDNEANVNDMTNKNLESGDCCRSTIPVLKNDASSLSENETNELNSSRECADPDDETTPLASLEKIAKEAETDFNSTIAGSLLNLETAPLPFGNDIDTKNFIHDINISSRSKSVTQKRPGLLERFKCSTKLGTIQEEGEKGNDDDGENNDAQIEEDLELS